MQNTYTKNVLNPTKKPEHTLFNDSAGFAFASSVFVTDFEIFVLGIW